MYRGEAFLVPNAPTWSLADKDDNYFFGGGSDNNQDYFFKIFFNPFLSLNTFLHTKY